MGHVPGHNDFEVVLVKQDLLDDGSDHFFLFGEGHVPLQPFLEADQLVVQAIPQRIVVVHLGE